MVSIAPAENPIMPMRSGSTCHFAALARTRAKAALASAIWGASRAAISAGEGRVAGGHRRCLPARARRPREGIEVCRRLVETVFEHERRDALVGQRAGDVPALVLHRQRAEAPAGCDDHRGAGRLRRVREEGREGGDGDVPRELAAVLAVPRLGRGRARQRARAELDRVGLRRDLDGRHLVVRNRCRRSLVGRLCHDGLRGAMSHQKCEQRYAHPETSEESRGRHRTARWRTSLHSLLGKVNDYLNVLPRVCHFPAIGATTASV